MMERKAQELNLMILTILTVVFVFLLIAQEATLITAVMVQALIMGTVYFVAGYYIAKYYIFKPLTNGENK